jgi:ATP-dependent helicase/nuclease subunit A
MTALPDHDARRAALTDFQRNLVVTAGAGTGKTSLLVGRLVAALVLHHLEPHQVLAVTFTENAASEMRERLIRMLESVGPFVEGGDAAARLDPSDAYILRQLDLGPENLPRVDQLLDQVEALSISTFHGFCLSLLRDNARQLDLPPDVRIGDTDGVHPGFEEAFLECLREASESNVHQALHRFDPTELRELALECIELPEDSLERIASIGPPGDLAARRDDLRGLIHDHPEALANWQSAAAELEYCYTNLLADHRVESEWIKKKTPQAGKQKLGDRAEAATLALDGHRRFLAPWVLADREGIAMAIDFVRPVLRRYRRRIATNGELGFQDLLLLARSSLRRNEALRREMERRLHCILVDEFQDTDPLQYDVVFMLAAVETETVGDPMELTLRPGSLFIVGDAKQSIYRFRRADVAAFSRAVQCVGAQGGRLLDLTTNFRSRRPILEFVNGVCERSLARNRPYQFGYTPVVPMLEGGDRVEVLEVDAEVELKSEDRRRREGNIVVQKIAELHDAGRPFGDMAILLRATTETSWILRPLRATGIPYVLEGSRRFYQRQEVILCRALLAAMAHPHDPVAVLALLRSSLSNAPDAEIIEYLQSGRSIDFRDADGAGDEVGAVAACLSYLRRLHQEILALPVDEAITHLLTLPELRIAEGAGFEGAQRLANLERLLHKLLGREPLDLAEAASSLAQNTDVESDDEESPLFDGGVAAVRVLTVHRAKGLEFPVVFLPDLARQSAYRERTGLAQAQRLFDEDGIEMVTVRVGDTRNVASLIHKDAGRRHDEAEQRRLFYVAATRAKERLFLVRAETASAKKRLWQEDAEVGSPYFDRSCVAGSPPRRKTTRRDLDPAPALLAAASHEELREQRMQNLRAADVAPSHHPAPPQPIGDSAPRQLSFGFVESPSKSKSAPATTRPSSESIEIGTAMHAYLALVDLSRDSVDEALLDRLPFAEQLRDMALRYHRSTLRSRLAGAIALRREIPLTFVDDGAIVHGIIDLIVEDADGSITILDWKTDRLDTTTPEVRADSYRGQLASYGRGVRLSMGLQDMPKTEVHFLRSDVTVRL